MYKMFIADDEHFVIKSLKASINWQDLGFEIIGEAYDGTEAYEQIARLKPDIAFVDIRMPGMNGLELMKRINGLSINTVFVVISGYAEFAYAQKAISYGALGFCLKPFEESELLDVLKKAAAVIEKKTVNTRMEMLSLIDDHSPEGLRKKREMLKSLGNGWDDEKGITVMVSTGEGKLDLKCDINQITLKTGTSKYAYIFNGNIPEGTIELLRHGNLPAGIKSIGISNSHNSHDSLDVALGEAGYAAEQYFMTGEKGIYRFSTPDTAGLDDLFRQIEAVALKKDIQAVNKLLGRFQEYFSKGVYSIRHAFQLYNIIIYSFGNIKAEKSDDFILNYELLVRSFNNAREMLTFLRNVVMEYVGISKSYINSAQKNETFKNILNHINEHYTENISIGSISHKFNVNPNYVSQLFKKEEGIAFTEYITKMRINYSGTLLRTTALSVTDVAEKSGFSDYYYFTRVFKRITGKTPTAYRSEN